MGDRIQNLFSVSKNNENTSLSNFLFYEMSSQIDEKGKIICVEKIDDYCSQPTDNLTKETSKQYFL